MGGARLAQPCRTSVRTAPSYVTMTTGAISTSMRDHLRHFFSFLENAIFI